MGQDVSIEKSRSRDWAKLLQGPLTTIPTHGYWDWLARLAQATSPSGGAWGSGQQGQLALSAWSLFCLARKSEAGQVKPRLWGVCVTGTGGAWQKVGSTGGLFGSLSTG